MERLTENKLGQSYPLKDKASSKVSLFTDYDGFYAYFEAVNRLGCIEDILGDDYDLDRVKELVEADKAGRCAIIPPKEFLQKLGGEVYILEDEAIFEALLGYVGYTPDGEECIDTVYALGCEEEEEQFLFKFSDVGKTVFATREEAEAALEKMKEG